MSAGAALWHPLSHGQFRLLRVDRQAGHTVKWHLETHDTNRAPPFAALSYVCGRQFASTPLTVKVTSSLNDGVEVESRINITANLETTLNLLSQHARSDANFLGYDYIWVDAICINQVDLQEKAAQVAAMYKIYTAATEVVICLGDEEGISGEIMTILRSIAALRKGGSTNPIATSSHILSARNIQILAQAIGFPQSIFQSEEGFISNGLPSLRNPFWAGLAQLYSRDWFHRLWTFQEAMLARKAFVICGAQGIVWQDMLSIAQGLTTTNLMYVAESDFRMPPHAQGVVAFISNFDLPYDGVHGPGGWFPIYLSMTRAREVTQAHDRIYAILSLAPPRMRDSVVVDYTIPVQRLYKDFTKRVFQHFELSVTLTLIETAHREESLPSWCPDYSQAPTMSGLPECASIGVQYPKSFREHPELPDVVIIRGAPVDEITAIIDSTDLEWQWRGGTPYVFGPRGDAAAIARWLDACWDLIETQKPDVLDVEDVQRIFTSAILANVSSKPDQDPPYPTRAIEGLSLVRQRMAQLREAADQSGAPPLSAEAGQLMQPVFGQIGRLWKGNVFFATRDGKFGIVSRRARVRDQVCVLYGEKQMHILRETKGERYQYIGKAYVTDLSDGRGFPENIEALQKDFLLV